MKNKKIFFAIFICFFVFLFNFTAFSKDSYIEEHVVKKGDTLWDISDKYWKNPFLWPKLWEMNQYITNPHLIYPGYKVKLYEEILEAPPPIVKKKAPPPLWVENIEFAGFITDKDMKGMGVIIESDDFHENITYRDLVYFRLFKNKKIKIGDRLTIYRIGSKVRHPITKKIIGKKILVLGHLRVMDKKNNIYIGFLSKPYREIFKGDRLMPYKPLNKDIKPVKATTFAKGYIIDSRDEELNLAQGSIVYIDKGIKDNVVEGNIFEIFLPGKKVKDPITGKKVLLPDQDIGKLMVLSARDNNSTALVLQSFKSINIGFKVEMKPE
ncbi:MAG: LysM peptidoglycan-binding domain-containing protein [Deltaproteobacteria bacterium]|nr:LysM peptidoglycan-binding domain-containing protein [Deltaproteobacteria bacterium]